MGRPIDDLLRFFQTGRTGLTLVTVDMARAAMTSFAQVVQGPESRSRISFDVDGLPDAPGDPALLQRVWEILFLNEVKFSATRERPEICVDGGVEGDAAVYRVRDNGVGFDMRYVDKLFGVFNRLHGVNEFEGTGIGLALVKRIVEKHGGRIWAEGAVGEGATFSFSLPVDKRSESSTAWKT